jgi:hypothetical protein
MWVSSLLPELNLIGLVHGIHVRILDDIDVLSGNNRSISLCYDVEHTDQHESQADYRGVPWGLQ